MNIVTFREEETLHITHSISNAKWSLVNKYLQIQHHEATLQRIAGSYTVIKATIMNPIQKICLSKLKDNLFLWNLLKILAQIRQENIFFLALVLVKGTDQIKVNNFGFGPCSKTFHYLS